MLSSPASRRDFLKVTVITLGGAALACSGLTPADHPDAIVDLPEFTFGDPDMTDRILVTYSSRFGSTAGVAEAIGKSLAEGGAQVDVLPMQDVKDLSAYRAVVAGSAIRDRQWLPEGVEFVRTHRVELSRKPFAAFLVCMTLAMPNAENYRAGVAEWLEPVRALVRPASEGLFAGVLDIDKISSWSARLKFRISVAMGVWSEGDHRDWKAIRAWAEGLRPLLASQVRHG